MRISVYQQDCCGREQWRVMRDDGGLVFDGLHLLDFNTEKEAVDGTFAWARRNGFNIQIRVRYRMDRPLRVLVG